MSQIVFDRKRFTCYGGVTNGSFTASSETNLELISSHSSGATFDIEGYSGVTSCTISAGVYGIVLHIPQWDGTGEVSSKSNRTFHFQYAGGVTPLIVQTPVVNLDSIGAAYLGSSAVTAVYLGADLIYSGSTEPTPPTPPAPVYSAMPFTIEALESGNITIKPSSSSLVRRFYYSINGGNQELLEIGGSISAIQIPINQGDIIEFVARENQNGTADGIASFISFGSSSETDFKVYGNIMSLSYVDYLSASAMPSNYCYTRMFKSVLSVIDAENLVIPDVALTSYCFESCFSGATNLETMPQLNSTTLGEYCYQNMFQQCTSLTNVYDLPATDLTRGCYSSMFNGCTNLTTAPELPATALTQDCYRTMFQNCTSLATAPELPATDIVRGCYFWMFNGCSILNYIKCLATANFSVYQGLTGWVNGVSATGTFVKDANTTWPSGVNGIPENWTIQEYSRETYLILDISSIPNDGAAHEYRVANSDNETISILKVDTSDWSHDCIDDPDGHGHGFYTDEFDDQGDLSQGAIWKIKGQFNGRYYIYADSIQLETAIPDYDGSEMVVYVDVSSDTMATFSCYEEWDCVQNNPTCTWNPDTKSCDCGGV